MLYDNDEKQWHNKVYYVHMTYIHIEYWKMHFTHLVLSKGTLIVEVSKPAFNFIFTTMIKKKVCNKLHKNVLFVFIDGKHPIL